MKHNFSAKLKEARLRKGYTQAYVADLIGVSPSTYSRYESGTCGPDVNLLRKIVVALETTADELLDVK